MWPPASLDNEVEVAITRRAAQEIKNGDVVVVGYGFSAYVSQVLLQERRLENVDFMVEHGPIGGLPLTDFGFGNSLNPQVILDSASQLDILQGGCFDVGIYRSCRSTGNVESMFIP